MQPKAKQAEGGRERIMNERGFSAAVYGDKGIPA